MFASLGPIRIGVSAFTGPTQASEAEKTAFARHNVAEGKPVLQDRGDDLDTKKLRFFFDEAWCDPEAEMAKLRAARASRQPLPYVTGGGTYTGARYVVEGIDGDIKRTTAGGRIVRIDASMTLIEMPVRDLAGFADIFARAAAPGLAAAAGLNALVRS